MQAVPTTGRPAVDQRDHHLRHEADQPLHLEDVQPPEGRRRRRAVGVSPSAYWYPARPRIRWSPPLQNAQPPSFGDGPLPVSSTAADVGRHPGVVQRGVELVDGVRPERVAHLGSVEGDPYDRRASLAR